MIIASNLTYDELVTLTTKQISAFFPLSKEDTIFMYDILPSVLERVKKNFEANTNKYYHHEGSTYFNPFHSGQYCIYLYYLSNSIFKLGNSILADKVYYLNKIMNGCDLFYEVELPDIFMLDHPVGSVIGRAKIEDGFTFSQNCTIGNNHGIYPVIGKNVTLNANSSILGNSRIGDNVILGAYTCIKDADIPNDSIVFGQSPHLIIKKRN